MTGIILHGLSLSLGYEAFSDMPGCCWSFLVIFTVFFVELWKMCRQFFSAKQYRSYRPQSTVPKKPNLSYQWRRLHKNTQPGPIILGFIVFLSVLHFFSSVWTERRHAVESKLSIIKTFVNCLISRRRTFACLFVWNACNLGRSYLSNPFRYLWFV